jgi:pimeloyl-ACP methyl ester carboxylesterase
VAKPLSGQPLGALQFDEVRQRKVINMALFVQETGQKNKRTVVFLHGGGGAGWMWQPQIENLTDYHCLVPDLPEQGKSLNDKPFTIHRSANLISELIDARAHEKKANVIGLSEGAQVAVALLALAPEKVDHSIISSALVKPIPGAWLLAPWLVGLSFRMSVPPFKNIDWWIRLNMKYAAGVPDNYYPQFKKTFQELTESGFVNVVVENQKFRIPQGLEKVKAPTLILVGKQEYSAMRQSARDLVAAIPSSKGYEVTHKKKVSLAEDHNWSLSDPELFTRTIRSWLNDQPLPSELLPIA